MIWQLDDVTDLCAAFNDAGPVDDKAVATYLASAKNARRQQSEARPGVKRWYYLLADEPRISLCCVSMPLSEWQGGAYLIIGTREIIGEFAGNKHAVGRLGLQMKMQPLAWMHGEPDQHFASGAALLAEISEHVLDRREIRRTQKVLGRKYRWEDD